MSTVRFMNVELEVGPGVLVPREETELLAASAIERLRAHEAPRFIDMCCGSGNLACAIGTAIPAARGWASDLTDATVAVARRNVTKLGLQERICVVQGDLFAKLGDVEAVDAVVCNPPYISSLKLERDRASLLVNEPREAFDGGPYGLTLHQRVIKEAMPFVKPGGWLLFEMGLGQEKQLTLLFGRAKGWDEPRLVNTAQGVPRVVMAQRRTST